MTVLWMPNLSVGSQNLGHIGDELLIKFNFFVDAADGGSINIGDYVESAKKGTYIMNGCSCIALDLHSMTFTLCVIFQSALVLTVKCHGTAWISASSVLFFKKDLALSLPQR